MLSEVDRSLVERCLDHEPKAWEDFVDRYLGLLAHVVNHTASASGVELSEEQRDALIQEVCDRLLDKDFEILRRFRGNSSLATYLAVVTRRWVMSKISQSANGNGNGAGSP